MGEKEYRNHVSWIMFLLSILVIWAHSYNVELFSGRAFGPLWELPDKMQKFISVAISLTAVPGFFMLSAYQFYRNFTWSRLPGKWKNRFFSVVVPYVAWNILYYLGYVAATRISAVRRVVGKEPVPFNGQELFAAIFSYRYAPIFWYLYQLIILIILSPILYTVLKQKILGLIFLGAVIAAVYFHIDTQRPNTDALFYYSFGLYMSIHGRHLAEASYGKGRILGGIACIVSAAVCYGNMGQTGASVLWIVMFRFFLPVSIWLLFDSGKAGETRPWMRLSMFLYAIHFIVVRFVNKASALLLGKFLGEGAMVFMSMAVYFMLPVIVVAVSYAAALILGRYAPLVWRILSGGRSINERERDKS